MSLGMLSIFPLEIRRIIYEQVLVKDNGVKICDPYPVRQGVIFWPVPRKFEDIVHVDLIYVNRQIYHEAIEFLYANRFIFANLIDVGFWLQDIGAANRLLVRKISFKHCNVAFVEERPYHFMLERTFRNLSEAKLLENIHLIGDADDEFVCHCDEWMKAAIPFILKKGLKYGDPLSGVKLFSFKHGNHFKQIKELSTYGLTKRNVETTLEDDQSNAEITTSDLRGVMQQYLVPRVLEHFDGYSDDSGDSDEEDYRAECWEEHQNYHWDEFCEYYTLDDSDDGSDDDSEDDSEDDFDDYFDHYLVDDSDDGSNEGSGCGSGEVAEEEEEEEGEEEDDEEDSKLDEDDNDEEDPEEETFTEDSLVDSDISV